MMPDEEIDDIDVEDIAIPGQESEEDTIEFDELYTNPLPSMATDIEEEIDDDAIEFDQLYSTPESVPEEETPEVEEIVEPEVEEAPAVEEIVEHVAEEVPDVEEQEIPQTNAISEESSREIRSASTQLENIVQSMVGEDTNSLAATEIDIMEAKKYLSMHKLGRAKNSVLKAEQALVNLEEDVLYLRRSIAMLHRLLNEKKVERGEVENILLRLRNATSAAEIGDVSQAANEVEYLVDDLIGGNTSTLNPFFFRHFWLGVDTRWPAGGDTGVLLVRLINDGPIAMPAMRLSPPVPEGWYSEPSSVDLPIIAPGGNLPLRFDIKSQERFGADEIPLSRKLAISTGYEMRSGEVMVTIRAQNRSMEPLSDIVLTPWLPPGYTTAKVPFVERLSPDEVAVIRMQLTIDMGRGGRS